MIKRENAIRRVINLLGQFPVVVVTGPRQCGKTTLANAVLKEMGGGHFYDLEDPENPLRPEIAKMVLKDLQGLVVIDEFQKQPFLFELIRFLADRKPINCRFLILGSTSPVLVKGAAESLAGRAAYMELSGFSLEEVGIENMKQVWIRGGFPLSYLAENDQLSYRWRNSMIDSFLERDIPQLGIRVPAPALRRFWMMIAHLHGKLWNASELARAIQSQESTARHYLDILTGSYMIRQLQPWFENVGKRLVKSPKIYLTDSGILHCLLGLRTDNDVFANPICGFSWEGFAMDQVIRLKNAHKDVYFYKAYSGVELDLLIVRGNNRYGFEFKFEDAPKTTKSMHIAIQDLKLDHLWIIYPGNQRYRISEKIEVCSLSKIMDLNIRD